MDKLMLMVFSALHWDLWCGLPSSFAGGAMMHGAPPTFDNQLIWYFLEPFTLVAAILGFIVHHSRQKGLNRIRQLEQQHALELERLRIAQDMHDSLGADLTRIAMLAEMARCQPSQVDALQKIGQVAGIARHSVDCINELIWATDPHKNSVDALAAYLREYVTELLEPAGVDVCFDMPAPLPDRTISGELRRHLFLACKEALNNTLKHAGATKVCVRLKVSDQDIEIVVEDDGCGFCALPVLQTEAESDQKCRFGGGNGLRNLQKRMAGVGGTMQISSGPCGGTRIRFTAPLVQFPGAGNSQGKYTALVRRFSAGVLNRNHHD